MIIIFYILENIMLILYYAYKLNVIIKNHLYFASRRLELKNDVPKVEKSQTCVSFGFSLWFEVDGLVAKKSKVSFLGGIPK